MTKTTTTSLDEERCSEKSRNDERVNFFFPDWRVLKNKKKSASQGPKNASTRLGRAGFDVPLRKDGRRKRERERERERAKKREDERRKMSNLLYEWSWIFCACVCYKKDEYEVNSSSRRCEGRRSGGGEREEGKFWVPASNYCNVFSLSLSFFSFPATFVFTTKQEDREFLVSDSSPLSSAFRPFHTVSEFSSLGHRNSRSFFLFLVVPSLLDAWVSSSAITNQQRSSRRPRRTVFFFFITQHYTFLLRQTLSGASPAALPRRGPRSRETVQKPLVLQTHKHTHTHERQRNKQSSAYKPKKLTKTKINFLFDLSSSSFAKFFQKHSIFFFIQFNNFDKKLAFYSNQVDKSSSLDAQLLRHEVKNQDRWFTDVKNYSSNDEYEILKNRNMTWTKVSEESNDKTTKFIISYFL